MAWLKVVLLICAFSTLPASAIAAIGKALSVTQGADVTRAGKTTRLREGMDVLSGDKISTNGTGVVQLLFVDDTKIAVGPNASMVLDVSMLRGGRKAKSFTVQALGGSFRFISGKSRKRAYSVKTPTATMAVRGTTFDMWITSGNQSAMLVIEGTVQMCGSGGSCRSTSRQCSLFATNSSGQVGRPADRAQYDKALQGGFPFILSQSQLLPAFQADANGCGRETAVVRPIKADTPEPRRVVRKKPSRRKASVKSVSRAAEPKKDWEETEEPEKEEPEREEPEREEPREREETREETDPEPSGRQESREEGTTVSAEGTGDNNDGPDTTESASAGNVATEIGDR